MNKEMICKIEEATNLLEKLTPVVKGQPKEYYLLPNEIVFTENLALDRIVRALTGIRDELEAYIADKRTVKDLAYLHDRYGMTEEEIYSVVKISSAADVNIDLFLYNKEKITAILDLFYDIGVRNLCDIIITNPYMFYDTVNSIRTKIDACHDKPKLARLLNEDPYSLELIHLS